MARTPSLRALLGVVGIVAMLGPLLAVLVVGWAASPMLALAAGLAVSLLVTSALLSGGWWLIQQLEDLNSPDSREDVTPPPPLIPEPFTAPRPGPGPSALPGSRAHSGRGERDAPVLSPEPGTRNPAPSIVLVAEDDPIGQRVAAHLLQRLGFQADVVADGQAALEAVAARRYQLVLMDCQMPTMDGYTATAEIRRLEATRGEGAHGEAAHGEAARRLPIVALTASTLDADRQRCLAAGMDAYLTKPLDVQQLAAALERWIPRHPGSQGDRPDPEPDLPLILDPAGLSGSASTLSPEYREIFELFLQEAPRRIEALSAAAALPDLAQVARVAHTLAGSASSLGASRLAAASSALERLAREAAPPPDGGPNVSGQDRDAGAPEAGQDIAQDRGQDIGQAVDLVRRELRQLEAVLASRMGFTAER